MKTLLLFIGLLRVLLFFVVPTAAFAAGDDDMGYVLRPNDTISLSVYGEPDLSVLVRILKTGESSFPLLGPVKVTGMTVAAAAAHLRELYAKDYLVDPKLNLTVADYAAEFVAVFGAVRTPGQIPMPVSGHLDLATAMSAVGGLAENADANAIQLIRAAGTTSTFTMEAIQGSAGRTQLVAGDRIIVNHSAFVDKTVTILGQVHKPGPVPFPLKGKFDLINAIALAGGTTDMANPKKVSINRKGTVKIVDFRDLSQRGDQPFLMQPDDIVTVPERIF
ncbi:MAG: polysaccharide biosynthesis/export family protein [Verrucomicrobiota bacterium]